MKGEVRFDYARSKDNRFAERMAQGSIAVVLDPDVPAERPAASPWRLR